jgi:hypothetical protein
MEEDVAFIYRVILKSKHFCTLCLRQLYTKTQNSDRFEMSKSDDSSTETQHPWHRMIDRMHILLSVKFEDILVISFNRKRMSN